MPGSKEAQPQVLDSSSDAAVQVADELATAEAEAYHVDSDAQSDPPTIALEEGETDDRLAKAGQNEEEEESQEG